MPTFKLDGKDIPFEPGESIIKAAYRQGIEIPHYCWHPGLTAPANCRMCLVEVKPAANQRAVMLDIVEWDAASGTYKPVQKPKLQPACQMAAVEGQEVLSDSSGHVKEARSAVQEFLLLNHPVDCPICDQAGECKLQDYWLEHQQTQKRMRDEPVHKPKAVSFGPTIVYDAERCVMCTRCVRFMEEVAKDPVLDMRERGNLNEIFVAPGRQLEGHYTFMTEHVCPVGALTTKDFRFKARVWFLRTAKSVCQGCQRGCNTYMDYDSRNDTVQRYRPRDNDAVNKYWMCDEGMVSYKRAHDARLLEPKKAGKTTTPAAALTEVKSLLGDVAKETIGVVLSAQHSLEDNWALIDFARALGTNRIYVTKAKDGYEDDILIHRDKNSNTRGVMDLAPGVKDFATLLDDVRASRVTHLVALGAVTPTGSPEDATTLGMLRALVTISAHDDGPFVAVAHVAIPACTWAEAAGTYVNAKGLHQPSEKAVNPRGASKPAWTHILEIARSLDVTVGYSTLRHIRDHLSGRNAPTREVATVSAQPGSPE